MRFTALALGLLGCVCAQAQTVPSELLYMSIEGLLQTQVVTNALARRQRTIWHLSYTPSRTDFPYPNNCV